MVVSRRTVADLVEKAHLIITDGQESIVVDATGPADHLDQLVLSEIMRRLVAWTMKHAVIPRAVVLYWCFSVTVCSGMMLLYPFLSFQWGFSAVLVLLVLLEAALDILLRLCRIYRSHALIHQMAEVMQQLPRASAA